MIIAFKKEKKNKLFSRYVIMFRNRIILFSVALFFIIMLFPFKQICSATINSHPLSTHTTTRSDSSHSALKRKNTKWKDSASSDNNEETWSNAFNFQKSWGTTVDPRTGILIVHFKVGSLLSNLGHGPNIDLQLNYSSNASANPDGAGRGWSWNLTHFNRKTDQLMTSHGKSFWLHKVGINHWQPLYHKLYDIKIAGDKSKNFTITYASGLKEILSHDGYETRLEQQNGWGVNFIYHKGTHLLQSVVDDEGHKITIDRTMGYMDIISHRSDGQSAVIRIENHQKKPDKLVFLTSSKSENPTINLNYNNYLLTNVIYPSGLKKKFIFNCIDAIKSPVSTSGRFRSLCAVVGEETDPGVGQPVMKTRYSYSHANINGHDYLGFNSGLTAVVNNKKDTLFEAPVDYSYRTIKDDGLVKEVHVYNKYHLLIDEKRVSDHTEKILSETKNFFCNIKIPNGCAQTSFADLPVTYSLPLKIVTRVWGSSSSPPATMTVTKEYNNAGQVVRSKDVYGRVIVTHYCPVTGDNACPAEPDNWSFSRLPESVTSYPAPTAINIQPSQPKTIYNFYRKQDNLFDKSYILVLDHQVHKLNHKDITVYRHYYKDRANLLTYGLLKQTILTDTTIASSHAIIHDYNYIHNPKNHTLTTNVSVKLSPGKQQQLSSVTKSLFTNQMLEKTGGNGLKRRDYYYDTMNRLVQIDLDKDTAFAATLRYQYMLSPGNNHFIVTRVNGLQQKFVFDNAGRQLMHFNEMISASGEAIPGHWQLKKRLYYDSHGRVTEQRDYISDATGKAYILKTTKDYDDVGRISRIHFPDGETTFRLYDDSEHCMISYKQSSQGERSPVAVVQGNLLDKPIKKRILSASSAPLSSVKSMCSFKKMPDTAKTETITYDGWGRPVMTEDTMGRTVRKHYDELGYPDDMTDPVGNHIHFVYNLAGKMIEHWALPASGGRYLLSSAGYNNAGQMMYKAGEDGKKTLFTYTAAGQLSTAIIPGGHHFLWKYNTVGLPVAKYTDGKLSLQTDYDHTTAKPIKKQDITGITTWKYSIDGLMEQEKHTGTGNYPNYQFSKSYDNERRMVSNTDITGDITYVKYDKFMRIAAVSYQSTKKSTQTLYTQDYDAFSRISAVHYGSGVQRIIHYDNWGHKLDVTDTLNNQLLSRWQFGYSPDNNIVTLHQQTENNQEAILNYQYDKLDNLVSMHCNGSFGLSLCPRDTAFIGSGLSMAPVITSQSYTFTPLNRLSQVKEILQDTATQQTLNKTVTYDYNNVKAPLRLQQIETQWNQQARVIQHLYYDMTGNMTTDGEGDHITYNIFSQVTRVIKPDGQQSHYIYDGSGLKRVEQNASGRHYLFYNGRKLINEKISSSVNESHIIGYYGVARTIDSMLHEYTEQNYKQDVVGILTKTSGDNHQSYQLTQRNVYSPYGMVWHNQSLPAAQPLRNFFGFDGQRTDPATGWQFLGSGHRTYNPQQRYFVSEDPAGGGYAFASNNPIMTIDPSGNMAKWLKETSKILGYVSSLGFSAIGNGNSDGAKIAGSVVMTLVSVFTIPVALAVAGASPESLLLSVHLIPLMTGLYFIADAVDNQKLSMAANVIGALQVVVVVASIIFMPIGIFDCCVVGEEISGNIANETLAIRRMSTLARSVAENEPPPKYGNIDFADENESSALLQGQQSGPVGTANSPGAATSQEPPPEYEMSHISRGIDIATHAANLRNTPVDDNAFNGFRNTLAGVDTNTYRNAFRGLMASLEIQSTKVRGGIGNLDINTLFPVREDSSTIVVGKDDIAFIQSDSRGFTSKAVNDSGALTTTSPLSYSDVMTPFYNEDGELVIYEYYRIR